MASATSPFVYMNRFFLACVLVVIFSCRMLADDAVKVRVTPNSVFGPATISIITSIEPHPDNRLWCLVWDSEDGEGGSSCNRELNGADEPTTHIDARKFGPGTYMVQVTVVRVHDGKPSYYVAKTQLNVLEPGTPFVR